MDKTHLKTTMLSLTEDELRQASDSYAEFFNLARISQDDPTEVTDHAQAKMSADLAASFDDLIHDIDHKLSRLRELDFKPQMTVAEGAVVRVRNRNLVIAVSTAEFECEGQKFIGISANAPIYAAMEGKKAGETCSFNGSDLMVEAVY